METNFNKPNPKRVLGYLMAAAMMVFFSTSYAQNACTVTVDGGTYQSEVTWDITDATGAIIASGNCPSATPVTLTLGDCYDMNMYDSYGDGWNGNTYTITDDLDGTIYATGGLTGFVASGTDNFCPTAPVSCNDNVVTYAATDSWASENSFTITDCDGNTLVAGDGATGYDACDVLPSVYSVNLFDSYGDGGGSVTIDGTTYTLATGSAQSWQVGTCPVYGCTDSTAANYDSSADTDDGSCTYGVPGCTDALACNYDTAATADDGSCTYAVAGYDCAGACLSGEEVTLNLYDSWGDGWNGGILTINGVDYTIANGSTESFVFCMDLSVCTDIIYTAGSFSSENSWDLVDASGAVVASGPNASGIVGNTPGFDCAGNCLSGDQVSLNLYDSWGDGWNGGILTVDGVDYTVATGSAASFVLCMDLTVCTDIIYTAGSFSSENSWDVTDASGAVIASGPNASGNVGACAVFGCTDPAASNYDPAANTDDGSCTYCTDNYVTVSCDGGSWQTEVSWTLTNSSGTVVASGGAPYLADLCLPSDCYTVDMVDSFGDGWNGNIFNISMGGVPVGTATLTTGSTGTADISVGAICYVYGCMDPTAVNYDAAATADDGSCTYSCTAAPYCENFDGGVGTWTNNGWSNLSGSTGSSNTGPIDDNTGGGFYMYYETSGSPQTPINMTSECFDISGLTAPALTFYNHMFGSSIGTLNVYVNGDTVWTASGDQGNQWNWAQVDLSAYAGLDIVITIEAFYGGSFTGDIAIDDVCIGELLVIDGCTDPTATNYDPTANNDDGSCTYCTGNWVTVSFYDSFGDGWNGATMNVSDYVTGDSITSGTLGGGSFYTDDICLDDGCYEVVVGGGTWDSEITFDFGTLLGASTGSYLVSVGSATCPILGCTDPTALNYDAAADTDDGSCAYFCDSYVASASVDNAPSCNGAFDASATAYISGSNGNDYWLWSDGQTTSTAVGLAAGTYTCTITDSSYVLDSLGNPTGVLNGCSSTVSVTIDPTPTINIVGTTFDATPGNANGGVEIAVSGGTPCFNGAAVSLAGVSNTTTQWASNVFDVVATSDLQITSIDQPAMAGAGTANVYYRLGSAAGFEADATGWMLAGSAPLLANFTGETSNIPVSINMNAGQTISIYVNGVGNNVVFGAGVDSTYNSVVSSDANLSIISGFATGGAPGSGTTYPSAGSYDFGGIVNYSLSSYTYAWSTGATTQNVNGLPLGPVSVTVTDCNGCTAAGSWFILTNYVYGCMDTLASNYDASANTSWDQDTTGQTPACLYDGCTDPAATNYDATANNDDGSCTFTCMYYGYDDELTITMTPDWFSSEVSWYVIDAITGDTALSSAAYADGGAVDVQVLCADNGCYYVDGYDTFGDGWTSGSLDIVDYAGNSLVSGFTLGSATTYASSPIFSVGGANCSVGCTDTAYVNFDANAVIDDGSCSDSIVGCTDPAASNYTPFSNYDDGSCCYGNTVSITVDGGSWQGEVGWSIVASDGTVITTGGAPFAGDVCLADDCYTVDMTDSFGDGWNGNVFTASSGGSVIGSGGLTGGSAGSFTFAVGAANCDVYGCSDPAASNYDASVTVDDGSCCYDEVLVIETGLEVTPGDLEFGDWSNWVGGWNVTLAGDTTIVLEGTDNTGFGFFGDDNSGCFPEGCYEFNATGTVNGGWAWFNINGVQYDGPVNGGAYGSPSSVLFTLGNAVCPVYGCMDTAAVNYDAAADTDDGSCVYPCTDNEITFNTYDSWGDGWNGATYTVTDLSTGVVVATGSGPATSFELGTLCLPDGCYNITVGGGTFDGEITFDFDTTLVAAPVGSYDVYVGVGVCPIYGCTDSTAVNYDPNADTDDGSCILACQAAPYCENFDAGSPANWTNNGWTLNAGGTGSFGTGPSDDITGGGNYMYYETSGSPQTPISLTSLCLDVSTLAAPALSFYNHMYGATMGTLDVLVNGTSVWSQSGNQGDQWNWAQVDLSAYAGNTNITIDFVGTYGTSFTGDMAIDEVCVDEYLVIDGCTDPLAVNYDPTANNDDGSCTYCTDTNVDIVVDGGSFQGEVSWTLLASDGTVMATGGAPYAGTLCLPDDCYTVDMVDSWGDGWNGNTFDASVGGVSIGNGTLASGSAGSFDFALGAGVCPVYGCTDTAAVNYDSSADTDDGSCDYLGCTNPTATNYDATATIDDGSCTFGCALDLVTVTLYDSWGDGGGQLTVDGNVLTNTGSSNSMTLCLDLATCYDVIYAATDSWPYENSWDIVDASGAVIASGADASGTVGNCFVQVDGCTDPTACNYDATANTDDGSCILPDGCTDPSYVEYDANATCDDGSCATLIVLGCTDPAACNYDATANTDDGSCLTAYGCTDPTQYNYDANATCDDGSCQPFTYGCTDATADNYNSTVNTDDGSCIWLGCTDSTANNYDAIATVDDGTCTYDVLGCTDSTANNYDASANTDDGSCTYDVLGCTDAAADNYDATATVDDGSCTFTTVSGCTDPTADNYDATATVDDGSCTYPTVCTSPKPTGLYAFDIIDTKVKIGWDNMNSSTCMVLKYFVRYREVGATAWITKSAGVGNGLCQFGLNTTEKWLPNLTASTTYEFKMKAFYCGGTSSNYSPTVQFTTADPCPDMINLAVQTFNSNAEKAKFTWDTTGVYVFARVSLRVDTSGAAWQTVGGFGINWPTFSQNKFGLTPGESYRAQGRTFCDNNITAYRSATWTSPIFWSQPSARMDVGTAIVNLDVYPNPSRDVFNVAFTSEDVQDLEVRVINVVGEVVYTENLQQFVGEYTKSLDLGTYTKGVYFLEITTNSGVVNKKLILQ